LTDGVGEESFSSRRLATALSIIFFLSGGASLLFETLWFRLSGLVFGNSAWASAIVLASFMAGLAIGNALSTVFVRRWREPLRVYAALEITIGISGLLLVLLLPLLPALFAPLFRLFLDSSLLNPARLVIAFVLLLVPATVMGATLPTVVTALSQRDTNFGRVLGLLYGSNTMGAVAGALAGELMLIRLFGVRGTGVIAALCSIAAGLAAAGITRLFVPVGPNETAAYQPLPRRAYPLLLAALASGFALLALEVIWFRFVIFFVISTSLAFAVMLAIVLAGIGMGALLASAMLSRFPDADRYAPVIGAAAAAALILSYSGFVPYRAESGGPHGLEIAVFVDSVRLMLPVSVLSGILFTVIGRAVERMVGEKMRAAAVTTFANTIGAAIGPMIAGMVLIPSIGVENSFFAVAVLYAAIAALTVRPNVPRMALGIAGATAVLTLVLFPFHLFANYFLPVATRQYRDSRIIAVREGPIETAVMLRRDYAGAPYAYRLFTNGFSMSGTTFPSKRYMSAFVYLPLALRPRARNALLISYGVGVTAKRLTEARQLDSIDIVDISKSILDLSSVVWPGVTNPLVDARARVHVEDGRFFLLTTPRRFDLITAEPPPPKSAGVVNLYTREQFQLMYNRLAEGGIASYWLPAYQLTESDNKAVIRAFCDAFADCSLWTGAGAEWILIGSRGPLASPSYADFARLWHDGVSGPQLVRLGIETPEQLAAMFLADGPTLQRLTAHSLPLTDNHPLRLSSRVPTEIAGMVFGLLNDAPDAFVRSPFVRAALPAEVRVATPRYFSSQRLLDRLLLIPLSNTPPPPAPVLQSVLTTTNLRTLPRLLFGSDAWLEDIALSARARGDRNPSMAYIAAVGALSDRDYHRARDLFAEARRGMPGERELPAYEALAASLAR
jgi:predicted membrane-bound spermidine synthase